MGPLPSWIPTEDSAEDSPHLLVAPTVTFTLKGRVVDARTRAPVAGATIKSSAHLWRETASEVRATTARDGTFTFRGEISEISHLTVEGPPNTDFVPLSHSITANTLRTSEDSVIGAGDLALEVGGSVSGFVLDRQGAPIAGAEVRLGTGTPDDELPSFLEGNGWNAVIISSGSGDLTALSSRSSDFIDTKLIQGSRVVLGGAFAAGGPRTVSDSSGRFVLRRVPPGMHTIVAKAPGRLTQRKDGVGVQPRGATQGVRFALEQAPGLEVEVVDEGGRPILDATLAVTLPDFSVIQAKTDARGRAQLRIDSRHTLLTFEAEGYVADLREVVPGTLQVLRVVLRRAARIRGQVPSTPGQEVVEITAIQGANVRTLNPSPDGRFDFSALEPGSYALLAETSKGTRFLTRVEVRAGEDRELGILSAQPLASLRVTVQDERGRPLPDASVWPSGARSGASVTNEEGHLDLDDLNPGRLRVRLQRSGAPAVEREVQLSGGVRTQLVVRLALGESRVVVRVSDAGEDTTHVSLLDASRLHVATAPIVDGVATFGVAPGHYRAQVLSGEAGDVFRVKARETVERQVRAPRPLRLRGRVVGLDGAPIAGAHVRIGTVERGVLPARVISGEFSAQTDAEGRFEVESVPSEGRSLTVFHGNRPVTFRLRVGTKRQTFRLPPDEGVSLRGRVSDTRGPLSRATVRLVSTGRQVHRYSALSDESGEVRFPRVAPGAYRLVAEAHGRVTSRDVVVGTSGQLPALVL
jgi:protocatechuate 3,4-dioxygenase beta subunit